MLRKCFMVWRNCSNCMLQSVTCPRTPSLPPSLLSLTSPFSLSPLPLSPQFSCRQKTAAQNSGDANGATPVMSPMTGERISTALSPNHLARRSHSLSLSITLHHPLSVSLPLALSLALSLGLSLARALLARSLTLALPRSFSLSLALSHTCKDNA
jgi:hypothetical protein